ncbi:hypothetical protein Tco_1373224, partial [Tanacetum coccineum]
IDFTAALLLSMWIVMCLFPFSLHKYMISLNGDDENEQSMTWLGYLFVHDLAWLPAWSGSLEVNIQLYRAFLAYVLEANSTCLGELIFELQNCNTSRVARANVTKLKTLHTADLRKSRILMRMVTETHNKIVDKIEFAVRQGEM